MLIWRFGLLLLLLLLLRWGLGLRGLREDECLCLELKIVVGDAWICGIVGDLGIGRRSVVGD